MKKLLKALAALVLLLIALVLLHPVWIAPVARTAVSALAPKFLGVPAKLDGFALNAYTGRLEINGLTVDNPPTCGQEKLLTLGSVRVGVNTLSLFSDTIVVDEISVRDFFMSFMSDKSQPLRYNFMIISEHASGGKKSDETAKPDAKKDSKKQDEGKKPDEGRKPGEGKKAKKVVIDLFQAQNSLVKWNHASFPLPSFRLTGVGRSTSGLEINEARREIRRQFFEQLGPLAKGLLTILETSDGFFGAGANALRSVPGVTATSTPVLNAGAKVLDGTTKVLDNTAKAGSKVLEGTSETVGKGVDAIKSLFGK